MLGFVGAPFTLASYIVEGGSSKSYTHIKRLAFAQPEVLHALLSVLADNITTYVRYQVLLSSYAVASRCANLKHPSQSFCRRGAGRVCCELQILGC